MCKPGRAGPRGAPALGFPAWHRGRGATLAPPRGSGAKGQEGRGRRGQTQAAPRGSGGASSTWAWAGPGAPCEPEVRRPPPRSPWPVLRQGRPLAPPTDVPRAPRAFPQLLPQVAVNLVAQNHTRSSSLSPGTGLTGQTQEGRGRAVRAFREDRFRPFPAFSSFQSHRIPGEWPFPLVMASSAASSMSL